MNIFEANTGMLPTFKQSIHEDIPSGIVQEYWNWSLSLNNPDLKLWINTIGVLQFDKLTDYLLENAINPDNINLLQQFTSAMNVYLLYETISDNLAIGCARLPEVAGEEAQIRKEVIIGFNDVMIAKLKNPQLAVAESLAPIREQVQSLSLFDHSLSYEKQKEIAQNFSDYNSDASIDDIEFGGWELLVANIETASKTLEQLIDDPTHSFLQYNLIRRYEAVNLLLSDNHYSLDSLYDIGTSTILVPAVLAYYFAILSKIKGEIRFNDFVENGLIQKILDDVALMIRLLNDIGPALLYDKNLIDELTHALLNLYELEHLREFDIFELLSEISDQAPELTRIHKDLRFNEFNILLDSLTAHDDPYEVINYAGFVLTHAADTYMNLKQRLESNLELLSTELGDDAYSRAASRFVAFHEKMYSNSHDTDIGEYAV